MMVCNMYLSVSVKTQREFQGNVSHAWSEESVIFAR